MSYKYKPKDIVAKILQHHKGETNAYKLATLVMYNLYVYAAKNTETDGASPSIVLTANGGEFGEALLSNTPDTDGESIQ